MPFRVYLYSMVFFLRLKVIKVHLTRWNLIPHDSAHFPKVSISFWSSAQSLELLISLWQSQSSANSLISDVTLSAMSLMWTRNIIGPSTVPWGTPETTADSSDLHPFTTTHCCLLDRKESIQFMMFFGTPYLWSLLFSRSCGTVSNAFSKSKMNMSTCCLLSMAVAQSWITFTSWVSQLWFFLKARCLLLKMFFFQSAASDLSKWYVPKVDIKCTWVTPPVATCDRSFFLNSGHMLAFFHSLSMNSVSMDCLKNLAIASESLEASSF